MSKLIFKKMRLKNFRSVSNHTLEVDLNQPNTLITSVDNGSGKSTITLVGLCFALFGKPYGKGKKGSLVNSRNGRECLVELDFSTKGHEYTVRRGIKPDLFEIYEDGMMIDQDAAKKDYQNVLDDIIGVDEKILFNSVLIGRDKFVPFAEMSAQDRRHYIENMLDLNVFSVMNELNKEDIKKIALDLSNVEKKKYKTEIDIKSKASIIESLKETRSTYKSSINKKIESLDLDVSKHTKQIQAEWLSIHVVLQNDHSEWIDKTMSAMSDLKSNINQKESEIRKIASELTNIDTSDKCKVCGGNISVEHLLLHKEELVSRQNTLVAEKEKLNNFLTSLHAKYLDKKALQKQKDDAESHNKQVQANIEKIEFQISECKKSKERLEKELDEPQDFDKRIAQEEVDRIMLEANLINENKEIDALLNDKADLDVVAKMLKDDGIKSSIVNEYMPFLNKKVNEYLEKLNFILNINIDKEFNIEIVSPDRRGQSLMDLSSGQLRRIDLSIMLAWRDIGMATSSLSTNLLILDETLENLSAQGVSDFIEMFRTNFQNISLFVISQRKDEFEEFFERQIHLTLDSEGFTKIS